MSDLLTRGQLESARSSMLALTGNDIRAALDTALHYEARVNDLEKQLRTQQAEQAKAIDRLCTQVEQAEAERDQYKRDAENLIAVKALWVERIEELEAALRELRASVPAVPVLQKSFDVERWALALDGASRVLCTDTTTRQERK